MTTTSPATRVMLGLVLLVLALAALRQVSSPDVGFHLEAGNHILSGKGWPATDPFTYTVTDHPYLDTSWGFQVVLSLTERVSGAPGMVLLHVAMALTLFWLVARTARLVPGESSVLLLLLLLGGIASEPRFEVRPEMLSYTLLAWVLYLLHRHAEGLGTRLWLLPPIFLVWVNLHGLFVLGWVAMGCFVVGLAIGRRRIDWPLVGWFAASVSVGLINPYGWRALAFPLQLATRMDRANVFARNIGEFLSPWGAIRSGQLAYYLAPLACFVVFGFLVALSARSLWRQRRYPTLMLCVVFLPLALTMIRNIPPMVVACLPGAVWGLSLDRVYDVLRLKDASRRWVRRGVVAGILLATVGLGLRLTTDAYYVSGRRPERFGLSWNEGALPIDAAAWARAAGLPGRMLNHLNFGGYLMWALSEPVFIDGRLEVMGEEFFERYRRALESPAGLEQAVQRHGIGWIVFPYRLRPDLLGGLSRHPAWRLVYVDHLAAIFVRDGASADVVPHESVARVELPAEPVDVASLPGLGGPVRPGVIARCLAGLVRRQTYPLEAFNRGMFHSYRADPDRAAEAFAEAIRESGGRYHEIYNNLGVALDATGRRSEAADCYRVSE